MLKKIEIGREAYDKIMYYVHKAKFEISGFGNVQVINGIPTVTDIFLLDQENDPTETEMSGDAVSKAVYDHHISGMEGEMKFWWHSHVNMDVFWSSTDAATIKMLTQNGWFIHGVFNKKNEYRIAYSNNEPVSVFVDELELEIDEELITTDSLIESTLELFDLEDKVAKLKSDNELELEMVKLCQEEKLIKLVDQMEPMYKSWEDAIAKECDALFEEKITDKVYKKPQYKSNTGLVYGLNRYMTEQLEICDELPGKLSTANSLNTSTILSTGMTGYNSWRDFYNVKEILDPYGAEELAACGWDILDITYMQQEFEVYDIEDLIDFEYLYGDMGKYLEKVRA